MENTSHFEIDHDVVQEILSQPVKTASGHAAIYKYGPGKIMKFSNPHEVQVYENIKHFEDVKTIVPAYYGFVDLPQGELRDHMTTKRKLKPNSFRDQKEHCVFVIMEDLLERISSKPHITDIKLGKCNYEDDDPEATKLKHIERAKKTGMDVWGGRFDGISIHGRPTLHKQDLWIHTFPDNLKHFLLPECNFEFTDEKVFSLISSVRKERTIAVCNILIEKLSKIHTVILERNDYFNFLQSSILIVYEGDLEKSPYADARLIDFDHTHFKKTDTDVVITPNIEQTFDLGDAGVAHGINSVVHLLNELVLKFRS